MKKSIIALLALAGLASADSLTLNATELTSSNIEVLWTNTDIEKLTSWAFPRRLIERK